MRYIPSKAREKTLGELGISAWDVLVRDLMSSANLSQEEAESIAAEMLPHEGWVDRLSQKGFPSVSTMTEFYEDQKASGVTRRKQEREKQAYVDFLKAKSRRANRMRYDYMKREGLAGILGEDVNWLSVGLIGLGAYLLIKGI